MGVTECVLKLIFHGHISSAFSIFKLKSVLIPRCAFMCPLCVPHSCYYFQPLLLFISKARKRFYHSFSSFKPFFSLFFSVASSIIVLSISFWFVWLKSWLVSSNSFYSHSQCTGLFFLARSPSITFQFVDIGVTWPLLLQLPFFKQSDYNDTVDVVWAFAQFWCCCYCLQWAPYQKCHFKIKTNRNNSQNKNNRDERQRI